MSEPYHGLIFADRRQKMVSTSTGVSMASDWVGWSWVWQRRGGEWLGRRRWPVMVSDVRTRTCVIVRYRYRSVLYE